MSVCVYVCAHMQFKIVSSFCNLRLFSVNEQRQLLVSLRKRFAFLLWNDLY